MIHQFKCRCCGRIFACDSDRKIIVNMMRRNANMCEAEDRLRIIERFGDADRTLFQLSELVQRLGTP
jgi:hypothetical protein